MVADTVTEDKGLILNGWKRSGGCHKGCGACCDHIMMPLNIHVALDPGYEDWKRWLEAHGVSLVEARGGLKARVPLRCAYLTWDNQCSVHGTEEQPRMCVEGPRLPSEIVGLEEVCTYKWERLP